VGCLTETLIYRKEMLLKREKSAGQRKDYIKFSPYT